MNEMSIAPLARQIRLGFNFCPRTCEHPQEQWPWAGLHQDFLILSTKSSPVYSFITSSDNILVPLSLYPFFFKMMLWPLAFNNWYLTTYSTAQTSNRETSHPYKAKLQDVSKKVTCRMLLEPRCIVWISDKEYSQNIKHQQQHNRKW